MHLILIPEFPGTIDEMSRRAHQAQGPRMRLLDRRCSGGLRARGQRRRGRTRRFREQAAGPKEIGKTLASMIEKRTGLETRSVVFEHTVRGERPFQAPGSRRRWAPGRRTGYKRRLRQHGRALGHRDRRGRPGQGRDGAQGSGQGVLRRGTLFEIGPQYFRRKPGLRHFIRSPA